MSLESATEPNSSARAANEAGAPAEYLALRRRIEERTAIIGVIGLGYVGLPLTCAAAEAGLRVAAFDVDADKVARLRRGESYLRHLPSERIAKIRSENASVEDMA